MKKWIVLAALAGGAFAAWWFASFGGPGGQPPSHPQALGAMGFFVGAVAVGFVALMIWFLRAAAGGPAPRLPLSPGEEVFQDFPANHQVRIGNRGGHLALTNKRLLFHPHRFNFDVEPWALDLAAIRDVRTAGALVKSVAVRTSDAEHRFVVATPGDPHRLAAIAGLIRSVAEAPEEKRPALARTLAV